MEIHCVNYVEACAGDYLLSFGSLVYQLFSVETFILKDEEEV